MSKPATTGRLRVLTVISAMLISALFARAQQATSPNGSMSPTD